MVSPFWIAQYILWLFRFSTPAGGTLTLSTSPFQRAFSHGEAVANQASLSQVQQSFHSKERRDPYHGHHGSGFWK
ncbi:hypothetical protein BHE90_004082 [Fusarium euwallaceae]|uniref:Secreted protein n=1 Tax=Fusarium euwallaceae TaxID=1147111 RepID=A0A430M058_9HYPO|nr:hypothetical protein BHE90_004082 [Fusarium euwallaceae]